MKHTGEVLRLITFSFVWKTQAKDTRFSCGTMARWKVEIASEFYWKFLFLSRCLPFLSSMEEREKVKSKLFADKSIDKSFFMNFKLHFKSQVSRFSFSRFHCESGLKRYRNWSRKWQTKLHHLFKSFVQTFGLMTIEKSLIKNDFSVFTFRANLEHHSNIESWLKERTVKFVRVWLTACHESSMKVKLCLRELSVIQPQNRQFLFSLAIIFAAADWHVNTEGKSG
jgi:hypothetical protein